MDDKEKINDLRLEVHGGANAVIVVFLGSSEVMRADAARILQEYLVQESLMGHVRHRMLSERDML